MQVICLVSSRQRGGVRRVPRLLRLLQFFAWLRAYKNGLFGYIMCGLRVSRHLFLFILGFLYGISVCSLPPFRMESPQINYDDLVQAFLERRRIALVRRYRELGVRNALRLQQELNAEQETFKRALSAHAPIQETSGSENPRPATDATTPPGTSPDLQQLAAKADKKLREYCTPSLSHLIKLWRLPLG